MKAIANKIKNVDNIIIIGHSDKEASDELCSNSDHPTTVSHILNLLKKTQELREDKHKPFKISLVACSGINIGRNLITQMQENGLYGRVTARNHEVFPNPWDGRKYNKPFIGDKQHQYGDYKRVLMANKEDCLEYKITKEGKKETLIQQKSTPKENLRLYFDIEEAIARIAESEDPSPELTEVFKTYKPSEIFQYLYEHPDLFAEGQEELFKTLLLKDAQKKHENSATSENARHLLETIHTYIVYSTWKTGLGGVTVSNKDYGNQIVVSHTMVKILDTIDASFKTGANLSRTVSAVEDLVKNNKNSLFRHKETQDFYNNISKTPLKPKNDFFHSVNKTFKELRKKLETHSNTTKDAPKPPSMK